MPQRVVDIRNRIAVMVTQRQASGIHPAAEVGGQAKPMRKLREVRGFIKGGIGAVVGIVVEEVIPG
ncbi:hypothetical protein A3E14_04430 [Candidatus Curtissbacteria bacterium RIFCSPHIGHO2_12_FULL_41_13]|nr:MAG: hypothetical protein A3E14_04430 [Candidatus Curtissbacteria bacterium RIFCSPHIGHO2_12_FULL_41_13]